tara:strand:+ start:3075 stop:3236 length:162 start_codon:yes stop_codon:yes gene_type:complete
MKIILTLSEALRRVNNWISFCEEFGVSEYAVNSGFGHHEIEMTEEQAKHHGVI